MPFFILRYSRGDRWEEGLLLDPQPIQLHYEHLLDLHQKRRLVITGSIDHGRQGELAIIGADTEEKARATAETDPAVVAEALRVEVSELFPTDWEGDPWWRQPIGLSVRERMPRLRRQRQEREQVLEDVCDAIDEAVLLPEFERTVVETSERFAAHVGSPDAEGRRVATVGEIAKLLVAFQSECEHMFAHRFLKDPVEQVARALSDTQRPRAGCAPYTDREWDKLWQDHQRRAKESCWHYYAFAAAQLEYQAEAALLAMRPIRLRRPPDEA